MASVVDQIRRLRDHAGDEDRADDRQARHQRPAPARHDEGDRGRHQHQQEREGGVVEARQRHRGGHGDGDQRLPASVEQRFLGVDRQDQVRRERDRVVSPQERLVAEVERCDRVEHRHPHRDLARDPDPSQHRVRGHADQRERQQVVDVVDRAWVAGEQREHLHDQDLQQLAVAGEVVQVLAERGAEMRVGQHPAVVDDALDLHQGVETIAAGGEGNPQGQVPEVQRERGGGGLAIAAARVYGSSLLRARSIILRAGGAGPPASRRSPPAGARSRPARCGRCCRCAPAQRPAPPRRLRRGRSRPGRR
jgi:hypothetical protein